MDLSNPQIITAFAALGGIVVGSASTLLLTYINRRFDDRRHLRQLAIETAVENWKQDTATATAMSANARGKVSIAPLDTYIIHMLQLAELVSSKRITAENAEQELKRIQGVSRAAEKASDDQSDDAP